MSTRSCLDEAAIQAYLDGELSTAAAGEAARHAAGCGLCADALAAAESEMSFFAETFAPAADLSVPTERLRARVEEAVAALRPASAVAPRENNHWSFAPLLGWLSATFAPAPRHATAFASILALVALAALFGFIYLRRPDADNIAQVKTNEPVASAPEKAAEESQTQAQDEVRKQDGADDADDAGPKDERKKDSAPYLRSPAPAPRERKTQPRPLDANLLRRDELASLPDEEKNILNAEGDGTVKTRQQLVPGEENYLRAVASLSKMIETGGDAVLRPTVRADYERNLALVNRAIEDTRRAALRNPKDADATGYLFSSYQTKIDLLRSVADQAQVATLGR